MAVLNTSLVISAYFYDVPMCPSDTLVKPLEGIRHRSQTSCFMWSPNECNLVKALATMHSYPQPWHVLTWDSHYATCELLWPACKRGSYVSMHEDWAARLRRIWSSASHLYNHWRSNLPYVVDVALMMANIRTRRHLSSMHPTKFSKNSRLHKPSVLVSNATETKFTMSYSALLSTNAS